uniref:Ubiquitin-like domain-containing protein n=1 Tax=Strongyloides stercoralis TaxID=6248 RepID=A0AAF5CYD9_STRER
MSSTTNNSSAGKEKIKISFKKITKNRKSKEDIKKESDALVLKLRMASLEKKNKNMNNDSKRLGKEEKIREKNLRIFNALYATPYDDPDRREEELANTSYVDSSNSNDYNTESFNFFTSFLSNPTNGNSKDIKNEKEDIGKKVTSTNNDSNLLTETESQNESLKKSYLSNSNTNSTSKGSIKTKKLTPSNIVLSESSKQNESQSNASHQTSIQTASKDEDPKLLPVTVMIFKHKGTPLTTTNLSKQKDEGKIKSPQLEPQLGGIPGKGQPASDAVVSQVMKKINERKKMLEDAPLLRFVFRNAFTNKIQFSFFHTSEGTVKNLKSRLKKRYNFVRHIFYNGMELADDDKKLADLNLPINFEFTIVPKITSGDYSNQEYSQMNRVLDMKKQFFQNIMNITDSMGNFETEDVVVKKLVHKFVTMTENERKKFDEDMKNKFIKLKELKENQRRKKASSFLISKGIRSKKEKKSKSKRSSPAKSINLDKIKK